MKATDLKIGQKYIWRRNSQTTHEAVYIGTDDSGKYTQYVFEYEKEGNKYYTYLSIHHVDSDVSLLNESFKYRNFIAEYINDEKCIKVRKDGFVIAKIMSLGFRGWKKQAKNRIDLFYSIQ